MAGVDPVVAVAGVQVVALAFGLTRRLVIAPDHIARFAAVDTVVAIAAEQPVVDVLEPDERVAEPMRPLVHLQAVVGWPASVATVATCARCAAFDRYEAMLAASSLAGQ